jgi:rhamnose transport system permease protein
VAEVARDVEARDVQGRDVQGRDVQALAVTPAARAVGAASWRSLLRWEAALVVLLVASVWLGATTSENYLSSINVFFIGLNVGEIAIMALPLTLIVVTGEIDLSVASMLGLSSTLLGLLFRSGWPLWLAVLTCLAVGLAGGALNGLLITGLGLPSIAVTIGTLTLFRGIAEVLLESDSVTGFPAYATNIGVLPVPGTQLATSIVIFLVLAGVYAVVLHASPLGRSIFAIGLQQEAAFFSGIRVRRIKFGLYAMSGLVCSFAGVLWTFRFATSRFDAGTGLELNVVAIVLLGGISIFGGRGSVLGVVLAVAIMGSLQLALTLINVAPQVQNIITGALLLASVVVPNGAEIVRRLRRAARRSPPPGGSLPSGSPLPPAGPLPPAAPEDPPCVNST